MFAYISPENAYKNIKKQADDIGSSFLETYDDGDSLMDCIISGDETYVRYVNCETKKLNTWNRGMPPSVCRPCQEGK